MNKVILAILAIAISISLVAQENQTKTQEQKPVLVRLDIAEAFTILSERITLLNEKVLKLESENYQQSKKIETLESKVIALENRPAFLVRGVPQSFSSNGAQTLAYTTGKFSFNIGKHFDVTTNKFTAPLKGLYWFAASCRFDGADISYFRLYFSVNDSSLDYSLPHSIADFGTNWKPGYATQNITGVILLNAGDTIKVIADSFSDTSWSHQGEDYFTGHLVNILY